MSSDSDKEEEEDEEEEELPCPFMVTAGRLEEETETSDEKFNSLASQSRRDSRKEVSGGRLPRRRWSRRTGSADGVLMVKSMLDLRLLDSFSPESQEEQQVEQEEVKTRPLDVSTSPCSQRRRGRGEEAGLHRTNQELGSTISLQVTNAWAEDDEARTNQRPDFIRLSSQSPDREDLVLYPDQWEDRVSLAGSEFQVKEACPAAAGGRQDKPSPDSGCSLGFNSRLSSPVRPAGDGERHTDRQTVVENSEPTEPLSVDGNSSELEEEDEEEGARGGGGGGGGEVRASQLVPQTPDQEAFLKEHFVTLADLSGSGSPSRASHSSTESLSISSRFLSQNSAGSRTVLPLPSRTGGGGGGGGGGEVKARPLVSEVRPLMEQNQNRTQDRRVSWNQDQTQKQNQDQDQNSTNQDQTQSPQVGNQIQQGTEQPQSRVEEEETSSVQQAHRPSPLKKRVQTVVESRRNLGPTARAAASHLNSFSGLRKAQSVQSLLTDAGDSSRSSRELLPPQRPTTLPSSPRRPPSTAPPPQRPSPASPRSPQQETAAPSALTAPRKSSSSSSSAASAPRSYMSPTASSMAKMSRSVSVGDGLNISEAEDPAVTSSSSSSAAEATETSSSQVKETPPPLVAVVPSNAALATPPHAAVVPVVVASSSTLGNHGNQAAPPPRGLQARVACSSRPLPDKPSIASFSPSSSSSSSSSRPPPVSISPLTPPRQEEEPHSPAGGGGSVEQRDDADQPISVETCRALTNELQSCFRRATHLYRKVSGSSPDDSAPDQRQMAVVLSEAFQTMRAELDCLPLGAAGVPGVEGGLGGVGEVKTAALLEEYSLLLLQAVHRRINAHDAAAQ